MPDNWTTPTEVIDGLGIQFDFKYRWNEQQTTCTLSNINWKIGKVEYDSEEKKRKLSQENEEGIPYSIQTDGGFDKEKLVITINNVKYPNDEDSGYSLTSIPSIFENDGTIVVENIQGNYLSVEFLYEYVDELDNGINVVYQVKIPEIKIPKVSKYDNNLVFTYEGINELLQNIKEYPVIDIETVDSEQWEEVSEGQPSIKIIHGNPMAYYEKTTDTAIDSEKEYYIQDNNIYTLVDNPQLEDIENYYELLGNSKYVKVGSNVKFYDINGQPILNEANGTQSTGTFRASVNNKIYEVPIMGLAGGSGNSINLSGDLLPAKDATYDIGAIDNNEYKWPAIEYDTDYKYYEKDENGNYTLVSPVDLDALFESQNGKDYDENKLPYYYKDENGNYLKVEEPIEDDIANYYLPKYYYISPQLRWRSLYLSNNLGNEDYPVPEGYFDKINIGGIEIGGDSSGGDNTPSDVVLGKNGWTNHLTGPLTIGPAGGLSITNTSGYTGAAEKPNNTNYKDNAIQCAGGAYFAKNVSALRVYNAVFNDYAECRTTIDLTPGHVVIDQDDGSLACSSARLQPGAQVISDTYGHLMGETKTAKTPIAVAGRVLVYTYQPRKNYHAGMAVCSAPNGTVDIMTREEICNFPDCIIGIVSEIPEYETWGSDNVKVDDRIWIKVK